MNNLLNLDQLIDMSLSEDLRERGDITSNAIFTDEVFQYNLIAKEDGILCGIDIFKAVINRVDPTIIVDVFFEDSAIIKNGYLIASISGAVASILKAERSALNFLSHLSAIATKTWKFVNEADGKFIILDTRKTIPGYRELHKYAVKCGGGENHRMGLFDMVMIKDNHIDAAGGITSAVERVRKKWGSSFKIEVETRNTAEILEAIDCGVDRIMLDNMNDEEILKAVKLIAGRAETEASGNMSFNRIKSLSATGVDYISFGELTNSVKAFDFSLREKI